MRVYVSPNVRPTTLPGKGPLPQGRNRAFLPGIHCTSKQAEPRLLRLSLCGELMPGRGEGRRALLMEL